MKGKHLGIIGESFGILFFIIPSQKNFSPLPATHTTKHKTSIHIKKLTKRLLTAANVSVSGRVPSADGQSIMCATVSLTDANGSVRSVSTNNFGYFQFALRF